MQHGEKNLSAGLLGRRIERRKAKGHDERIDYRAVQAHRQFSHGRRSGALKAPLFPPPQSANKRPFVAQAPATGAQNPCQKVPGLGPIGQHQAFGVCKLQAQRYAQQGVLRLHADQAQEFERFLIATNEDVLAVVQGRETAVGKQGRRRMLQGARAPTEAARGLKHRDPVAGLNGTNGSRKSCPSGADDTDTFAVHRRPSA